METRQQDSPARTPPVAGDGRSTISERDLERQEALSPPEKQLLRMGPQNAGRIKTTLRELRELMYSEGLLGS